MDIFHELKVRQRPYELILETCKMDIRDEGHCSVAIIIPVHGRTEFNRPVCQYFQKAIQKAGIKISLTVVEHSEHPQHQPLCPDWVNYIWIPMKGRPFNKCLAHNIGAIVMQHCDYFLFHDVDIIVPRNFFENLFKNMVGRDAVQTFTGRRLLHCNKSLTDFILDDVAYVESFQITNPDVSPAKVGALGGSIFLTKEFFVKVGGFDDCFFTEYSIEDAAFYEKMQLLGIVGACDSPPVELMHLDHPPGFNRMTKQADLDCHAAICALELDKRRELAALQSAYMAKYISVEEKIPDYVRGILDTLFPSFWPHEVRGGMATELLQRVGIPGRIEWNEGMSKFVYSKAELLPQAEQIPGPLETRTYSDLLKIKYPAS